MTLSSVPPLAASTPPLAASSGAGPGTGGVVGSVGAGWLKSGVPVTFTVAPPLAAAIAAALAWVTFMSPAVSFRSMTLPAASRSFPVMLTSIIGGPPAATGLPLPRQWRYPASRWCS